MKRLFSIIQYIVVLILLFSLVSCSNGNSNGKILPRLEVNTTSMELFVGEENRILAYSTVGEDIYFSSTNEELAVVDSNGLVKAISAGEVNVFIKAGDQEKNCKIIIKETVYTIELDYNNFNILIGTSKQINATLFRNGVKINKNVNWKLLSENGTISIDGNSVVFTAVSIGTTNLVANFENASADCLITIVNV